jgi:3-oxoacid CoA-transferase subunit A
VNTIIRNIYLTGDTHANFKEVAAFCREHETTQEDVMIILGDVGLNFFGGERDRWDKSEAAKIPATFLCVHGNHEIRPERLQGYCQQEWQGGRVLAQPEFPTLLFALDGEVYDLNGKSAIVIGGAYSYDKPRRLANPDRNGKIYWWEDEQPSDEIKRRVEERLSGLDWRVDLVLTHTCPKRYIPRESLYNGPDDPGSDTSTEEWLDSIESRLSYDDWYCGHWHIYKNIDRIHFMDAGLDGRKRAVVMLEP